MENEHDYTGFAIENILHPIIEAIEQEKCSPEKKSKLKEKAFASLLAKKLYSLAWPWTVTVYHIFSAGEL